MKEYEAVWEIYNLCSGNQMRDVFIEEIECEDPELYVQQKFKDKEFSDRDRIESLFVMGRAAMNFIDLCGVHKAYFEDEAFEGEGMIKSIGFSKLEDGRWFVDLTDFFVEPCQHGHGLKKE